MMEHWASEDWGWSEYLELGGELDRQGYDAQVRALPSNTACTGLLISTDHAHDKHPLRPLTLRPTKASLARLCADYLPSAGEDAPLALLGSVAEYYQSSIPEHRSLLLSTLAAFLYACPAYKGKPVYRYWLRNKPRVDHEFKQSVAELARSPLAIWRVSEVKLEGVHLESLCGLGTMSCPEGPVSQEGLSVSVGDVVLGRAAFTNTQWFVAHPIVLPCAPPQQALQEMLDGLVISTRLHYREASLRDVLRWRGDVLHRWCIERTFADSLQLPRCGTL